MVYISILFLVIIVCVLFIFAIKAWLWESDNYAVAEIDRIQYESLTNEITALKAIGPGPDFDERLNTLNKRVDEYLEFVSKNGGKISAGDTAAMYADNPATAKLMEYMQDSLSANLLVFGLQNTYDMVVRSLQFLVAFQMNNALQSFIQESESELTVQSNQTIALALILIVSILLIMSKTALDQWIAEKYGPSGPTLFPESRNMQNAKMLKKG